MKYVNKQTVLSIINKVPVRLGVFVAVTATVLTAGSVVFAYGPERPTYTTQAPADHITFNSITNNRDYGDERNFVLIKESGNTTAGSWKDEISVKDGEYLVRMYVHNNAAANLNLVATNTRVMANLPNATSNRVQIDGFLSADNANPQKIWDSVVMTSDKKFNVSYINGSARYYNNKFPAEGIAMSDSIVTNTGALAGYEKLDGKVPGCFEYSGVATFRIKVQTESPDFTVTKKVRLHGTTAWEKSITATPGQQVDYQIGYDNIGKNAQDNVLVKDQLPAGVTYSANTTTLKNSANPNGDGLKLTSNELVTSRGVNIGNYNANTNAFVRFTATIPKNEDLKNCGPNALVNTATIYTANGSKSDTATVNVKKIDCTPSAPTPGTLPTTGPAEVIAGLVGVAAVTLGVVYYIKSRKDLDIALHAAHSENDVVSKTHIAEHKHDDKK